ncbi:hypothetical protein QE357_002719 [Siphonobacter sp. BAB-5404]|nr:hypothetical protein [Siphonobacter sp. SORGH_AS_0500]
MTPKLDFKLTLSEFASLYQICFNSHEAVENRLTFRPEELILSEYCDELEKRIPTWKDRKDQKEYKFRLRLSVAMTIWQDRSYYRPVNTLLAKIDKALVDNQFKPITI